MSKLTSKNLFVSWQANEREDKEKAGRIPTFLGNFSYVVETKDEAGQKEWITYIEDIDKDVLNGGFFRGVPHVITGFPGSGKTTTSIQMATRQAMEGKRVCYISLEQSDIEIVEKVLGLLSGQSYLKWEEIKYAEKEDEFNAKKKEGSKLLFMHVGDNFHILRPNSMNAKQLIAFLKDEVVDKFDICYVDNFQNVSFSGKASDRTTYFDNLTNEVKDLIFGTKTAVVWLSQLSTDGPRDPKRAHTKWSNKLSEDVATWLLLYRKQETAADDPDSPSDIDKAYMDIPKNRKGNRGKMIYDVSFPYDLERERIGTFAPLPETEEEVEKLFEKRKKEECDNVESGKYGEIPSEFKIKQTGTPIFKEDLFGEQA